MIRAIAAIDSKRGLAANGKTPWDIPLDMHHFRDHTLRGTVVMGRTTYEGFTHPLSNRRNVVVSRSLVTVRAGFELMSDIDLFLRQSNADVWIIGGAQLYESALKYCDELYLTHVVGDFKGDRFFPDYTKEFMLTSESKTNKQEQYEFRFAMYERKKTGRS